MANLPRKSRSEVKKVLNLFKDALKEVKEELMGEYDPVGSKYTAPDTDTVAELYNAVGTGQYNKAKTILDENPEYINRYSNTGETLLLVAVRFKDKKLVQMLLDKGADVNAVSRIGNGTSYIPDMRGFDMHPSSRDRGTPLFYAVINSDEEMVRILLRNKADPNVCALGQIIPLHMAARQGDRKLVEMLIKDGAKIDAKDNLKNTPLFYAMTNQQRETARYLLQQGADKNFRNRFDHSYLHVAAENGDKEMLEYFIQLGLDVNSRNKYGETALYLTVPEIKMTRPSDFRTFHEMSELLLKAGAKTDMQSDADGDSVINKAARFGHYPVVEMLVSYGADVDIATDDAVTPLITMLSYRQHHNKVEHKNTVQLLLDAGADVNEKDSKHRTALQHACSNRELDIVQLLLEHKADPNIVPFSKDSPLVIAIERLHSEMVFLLLEHGADIRYQKREAETMVELARKQIGGKDIAAMLRDWSKHQRTQCKETAQRRMDKKQGVQTQRRKSIRRLTSKRKPQ